MRISQTPDTQSYTCQARGSRSSNVPPSPRSKSGLRQATFPPAPQHSHAGHCAPHHSPPSPRHAPGSEAVQPPPRRQSLVCVLLESRVASLRKSLVPGRGSGLRCPALQPFPHPPAAIGTRARLPPHQPPSVPTVLPDHPLLLHPQPAILSPGVRPKRLQRLQATQGPGKLGLWPAKTP